ncbi:MAG: (2Fe-2S)-binding protein [Deltaproteobacteria bacterium]|nr:(2Fe-2S)-binding protein [Deltaproteobacteria bacterium]
MTRARRIDRGPGCPFERGAQVEFRFEGRTVQGYEGEPLAAALLANGVQVFGRSIKYHRPRGPSCMLGHCSGCLLRVDGVPNVRSCEHACRSGIAVERQRGWPSARTDLFRTVDWVYGRRLDHHEMFTASAAINRLAMRFVRRMSGFGDPPSADPPAAARLERFEAEVVVIGAGAAGMHAALALAGEHRKVTVFEADPRPGGRLLDGACRIGRDGGAERGWAHLAGIEEQLRDCEGVELRPGTPVLAVYQGERGHEVLASNRGETCVVDAARIVVATGAHGQIPLFENDDLPGIFSLRGLDRLLLGWGVLPAQPVLVAGGAPAVDLAVELVERGVETGLLTDLEDARIAELEKRQVTVVRGQRIIRALGAKWIDRVELGPEGSQTPELVLDCGLLAAGLADAPAYELAHHAGCRVEFHSESGYRVVGDERGRSSNAHVFTAGHCAGAPDVERAIESGTRAGMACALSLGEDPDLARRLDARCAADG